MQTQVSTKAEELRSQRISAMGISAAAGDPVKGTTTPGLARLDSKRALTKTTSLHVMGKVARAEELVGHGFSTVVLRRALCGGQKCELRGGERDLGERKGVRGCKSSSVACPAARRRPRRPLAIEVAVGAPCPPPSYFGGRGGRRQVLGMGW